MKKNIVGDQENVLIREYFINARTPFAPSFPSLTTFLFYSRQINLCCYTRVLVVVVYSANKIRRWCMWRGRRRSGNLILKFIVTITVNNNRCQGSRTLYIGNSFWPPNFHHFSTGHRHRILISISLLTAQSICIKYMELFTTAIVINLLPSSVMKYFVIYLIIFLL